MKSLSPGTCVPAAQGPLQLTQNMMHHSAQPEHHHNQSTQPHASSLDRSLRASNQSGGGVDWDGWIGARRGRNRGKLRQVGRDRTCGSRILFPFLDSISLHGSTHIYASYIAGAGESRTAKSEQWKDSESRKVKETAGQVFLFQEETFGAAPL